MLTQYDTIYGTYRLKQLCLGRRLHVNTWLQVERRGFTERKSRDVLPKSKCPPHFFHKKILRSIKPQAQSRLAEKTCICVCVPKACVCKSLQSCPTLCDPMDCSLPGSTVNQVLQARILQWVAIPPPENLHEPGIESTYLTSPPLAGRFFITSTTWEAQLICVQLFAAPWTLACQAPRSMDFQDKTTGVGCRYDLCPLHRQVDFLPLSHLGSQYMCVHKYIYAYMHIYIYIPTYIDIKVYIYVCVHVYIFASTLIAFKIKYHRMKGIGKNI